MRTDAHQLRNLPLARKLLESVGLILFTVIDSLTWVQSFRSVRQGYTVETIFQYWGNVITDIRNEDLRMFLILGAGNLRSMSALFIMSWRLFRRTSLRQRARFFLSVVAGFLTLLNVLPIRRRSLLRSLRRWPA